MPQLVTEGLSCFPCCMHVTQKTIFFPNKIFPSHLSLMSMHFFAQIHFFYLNNSKIQHSFRKICVLVSRSVIFSQSQNVAVAVLGALLPSLQLLGTGSSQQLVLCLSSSRGCPWLSPCCQYHGSTVAPCHATCGAGHPWAAAPHPAQQQSSIAQSHAQPFGAV